MGDYLLISDAAKEVKVESHVLRYWEEELHLPIKRNELGHRYYTKEDVERFKEIKSMKERGLQLKAIKMILRDGRLDVLRSDEDETETGKRTEQSAYASGGDKSDRKENAAASAGEEPRMAIEIVERSAHRAGNATANAMSNVPGNAPDAGQISAESREEKAKRLQWILQQMIREAVRENNQELCRELREGVVKELDYQFRSQEEREEERERRQEQRSEEYYQRMDELLRNKAARKRAKRGTLVEISGKTEKDPKEKASKEKDSKKVDQIEKKETGKKKRHFIF